MFGETGADKLYGSGSIYPSEKRKLQGKGARAEGGMAYIRPMHPHGGIKRLGGSRDTRLRVGRKVGSEARFYKGLCRAR